MFQFFLLQILNCAVYEKKHNIIYKIDFKSIINFNLTHTHIHIYNTLK